MSDDPRLSFHIQDPGVKCRMEALYVCGAGVCKLRVSLCLRVSKRR